MKYLASVLVPLSLILAAGVGTARAGHVCGGHRDGDHWNLEHENGTCGPWHLTELNENWYEITGTNTTSVTTDLLFQRLFVNCTDQAVSITITETRSREHRVTVDVEATVGVEYEAAIKALAVEVKSKAHASVTVGAGYEYTNTVTYAIQQLTTNPPHNTKLFKSSVQKFTAEGTAVVAKCRTVCVCRGCGQERWYWCDLERIESSGVGYEGPVDEWTTQPHSCPGGGSGGDETPPPVVDDPPAGGETTPGTEETPPGDEEDETPSGDEETPTPTVD